MQMCPRLTRSLKDADSSLLISTVLVTMRWILTVSTSYTVMLYCCVSFSVCTRFAKVSDSELCFSSNYWLR